jgi:ribosomal protein S18 acetylase RimI-like enzyme
MGENMEIRALTAKDLDLLLAVEPDLFDNPVDPAQARAFLADPLHHLVAAVDAGRIVAFASGTVLLHPDKPPSLFINEVGTLDRHQRRGLASAVVRALIARGRAAGCQGAWVGTEPDNAPARALYRKLDGDEFAFVGYGWDRAFETD